MQAILFFSAAFLGWQMPFAPPSAPTQAAPTQPYTYPSAPTMPTNPAPNPTQPAGPMDLPICVDKAIVRSGAGDNYYATGELYRGERVQVHERQGSYVAITPPQGSFSLVPADAVARTNNSSGRVKEPRVETLVGSPDHRATRRADTLEQGYQVTILDTVEVQTATGPKPHFKIMPTLRERRFLHLSAIDPNVPPPQNHSAPSAGPAFGAAPAGFNDSSTPISSVPPELPPDEAERLKAADQCYQQARYSGDWSEAEQRYQELAGSMHHAVRMTALNRLEFIRQKKGQPPEQPPAQARREVQRQMVMGPGGAWAREGTVARTRLPVTPAGYTPTAAGASVPLQGVNPAPLSTREPAVPAQTQTPLANRDVPARTTSAGVPPEARLPATNLTPAAGPVGVPPGPQPLRGTLRKAYQSHYGQPLYYVIDHQGMLKAYVTPNRGLNLEPLVNQIVEVQGSPLRPDPAMQGKMHTNAHKVTLLAK